MTDDDVPFVTDTDAPEEALPRRILGQSWPLLVAGALVAVTLSAVYLMLRPRGRGESVFEPSGTPAFVTLDAVALRREPSADSEIVATLAVGARVSAVSGRGPWVEVAAEAGALGYLPADAIERAADREARQRREKTLLAFAPVYGVVGEPTDVALAPYPLAARGGRLAKGTVIAIHSVDHSYFAFRDKTWGIAFVASAAVDLIPPDPREPAIAPEKVRPLKNLTIIDLEAELAAEEESLAEPEEEELEAEAQPAPPAAPLQPAPGLVAPPAVVSRVEPVYPELARRAGVEGTVELEVSIDASGAVTDVEVVRGLPLGLSEAAADAVHRWKYRPARTASGPVASRKSVRIRFVLKAQ
jgi:protein TonB